jgi:Ca-activated chloride channel homolog
MNWDLSQYQLDRPHVLWAVLLLVLFFLARERGLLGWPRTRLFIATLVRCFAFGLLVIALAGPHRFEEHPDLSLVFVVDTSGSSGGGRLEHYNEQLGDWWSRLDGVDARIVSAGEQVLLHDTPADFRREVPAVREDTSTDLGPSIELAMESFGATRSRALLLLSDGAVTEGWVDRAAAVASIRGVRVFPLPPDDGLLAVAARRLDVGDAIVQQGEELTVTLDLESNGAAEADVELLDSRGAVLARRSGVAVQPGPSSVDLTLRASAPEVLQLSARITVEGDMFAGDDVVHGALEVVGPPRVRVIGDSERIRPFVRVLASSQPPVDHDTAPDLDPEALDGVDLVAWLDPPLGEISEAQAQGLRQYVRRGGRLLVVGGPRGLAIADEGQEELKELLPVRFPKQERKEQAPLAVVYVIDRSDSMGRASKFEIALTAVAESVAMLDPESRVGVITFSDQPHWAVPMTTADDLEAIRARLGELTVHGGTSIYPALQLGYDALVEQEAKLKHMILLTDGRSVSTLRRDGEVVYNVARRKFTLSSVAIGRESDTEELQAVAEIGQGRYYYTEDFGTIPQILLEETMTVVRSNTVEEQIAVHGVEDSRFLEGIDIESIPDLEGYIRAQQRTTSELALATERGEPLLVGWRHGRGTVTLFTSDFDGAWSQRWKDWPQRATFWRGVLRETLSPLPAPDVDLKCEIVSGELRMVYSILDPLKNPRNDLLVSGIVTGPDGSRSAVQLQPSGSGLYRAELPATADGGYLVAVEPTGRRHGTLDASGGTVPGSAIQRSVGPPPPVEARAGTLNLALLSRLANETGGQLQPGFDAVLSDGVDVRRVRLDVWERLLWVALLLFVVDVGVRRLRLPRLGSSSRR